MGRLKVTPKGKIKNNIPITRIGKKQYVKRRFLHYRKIDLAGKDNFLTQAHVKRGHSAEQSYTRLGISINPSVSKAEVKRKKKRVREDQRGDTLTAPGTEKTKVARPVSEQEGTMIANLVLKYDTDFKRMALDSKLNPMQLKAGQLQKKVANYMKMEAAAFPEEHKQLQEAGLVPDYADASLRRRRIRTAAKKEVTPIL